MAKSLQNSFEFSNIYTESLQTPIFQLEKLKFFEPHISEGRKTTVLIRIQLLNRCQISIFFYLLNLKNSKLLLLVYLKTNRRSLESYRLRR